MELDEFAALYDRSVQAEYKITNERIMEIIQSPSNGPLAELQKKIRYTLYLFPASLIFFLGLFIPALGANEVAHNVTLWLLFLALFSEYIVALLNHYTIKNMQHNVGAVKENIGQKISLIKRRYQWYFVIYVILFSLMPIYLELGQHFHSLGYVAGLGKISIWIRLAWYVLVFGCIFVIRSKSQKQLYTTYLDQLNRLSAQLT